MKRFFRAWFEFLARQTRPPEDSKALRGLVALNVTIAILAVGQQLEWPGFSKVGLALTLAAMGFSFAVRRRNNWDVKAFLSVAMMLALMNFMVGLSGNTADPRLPLAELLVWLQTLHSFDLPGRRDLNYSLLVALVLMSVAAVLSVYSSYGIFLAIYAFTAWLALHLNYRRALAEIGLDAGVALDPGRPPIAILAYLAAGSLLVLLLLPRFQSFRIRALPMSLQLRSSRGSSSAGQIRNGSFPTTGNPEEFRKRAKFDPDSYAGFNNIVDLQMRGHLSDEIVLRVRSTRSAELRGLAFDRFDGQFWTQSDPRPRRQQGTTPHSLAVDFNPRLPEGAGTPADYVRENVQIIYVEKLLPNLVLAISEPTQLYFPSDEIYRDSEDSILSPYPMESGTVYSAISSEVREVPELLKRLTSVDPRFKVLRKRYIQLPKELQGENRVHTLALDITKNSASPYSKVQALVGYLHRNYAYDIDVPPYPEKSDVADYFLFEQKSGYCEQFATALAVLAREVGLPSRYVTGFLPGTYNPLTGYHEVKGSDAHAWTEIWIPNYGWLAFDATPPGTQRLKDEEETEQSRSLGVAVARFLKDKLGSKVFYGLLLGGGLSVLLVGLGVRLRMWLARPGETYFEEATRLIRARLGGAVEGTTPKQLSERAGNADFELLRKSHEKQRYGASPLTPAEEVQVQEALDRLRRLPEPRKTEES